MIFVALFIFALLFLLIVTILIAFLSPSSFRRLLKLDFPFHSSSTIHDFYGLLCLLRANGLRFTGRWAGVDSAWEQEKLEARKLLENGDESHLSSARFVRQEILRTKCSMAQGTCPVSLKAESPH